MKFYLAGPMSCTGRADFNYPAFFEAEAKLVNEGHEVLNPARNFGGRTDLPRAMFIRADIEGLLTCKGIALLPGWNSTFWSEDGQTPARSFAAVEYEIARNLGLQVRFL